MKAKSDGKGVLIRWLGSGKGGVFYNTANGILLALSPVRNKPKLGGWTMETKRVPSGSSQRVDCTRKNEVQRNTLSQDSQPVPLDTLRAEKAMTSSSLNSWVKLLPVSSYYTMKQELR